MSANPDAAEIFNHCLDAGLGVACLLFLAMAAWAVGAELAERRRHGAPWTGPWSPADPPGGKEVHP